MIQAPVVFVSIFVNLYWLPKLELLIMGIMLPDYQNGALLFAEVVHPYLPKWCIPNCHFWCIAIYRSQLGGF
jgi:hypothetical protein